MSGIAIAAVAAGTSRQASSQQREIRTVSSISPQERQEGAKAHPQLLAEFGGLYAGPQAAYVTSVGRRIAVQSSLSGSQSDFTVSLLNSSVNNAFAIPGGYIYVTRQLTALMNNEAELAGVLGHEVGHVAAQHGKRRQDAAQRNSILGVLGQVLVGAVAGDGALGGLLQKGIGTGSQLLTLRFSRAQEYEADDLGIRYLAKAGYDPRALSDTLASLAAQNALDARVKGTQSSVPAWASTHPDPASRVTRALDNARATGSTATLRNADAFLTAIDGMLYGDDPREGVVDGNRFLHPAFRLKFTVPQGFAMENSTEAVTVSGSQGQAQFTGGGYGGDLSTYVGAAFRKLAGEGGFTPPQVQRTTVNGLPAAFATVRATGSNGTALDVTVFAYEFSRSSAYHFLVMTPAGSGIGPFSTMVQSMARMTQAEADKVKARRVRLVTVRPGDTVGSLAGRMAYADYPVERFRVLNALPGNAAVRPGQRVKIVTY
ncbi:M48 family metalloprotease [Sphingobium sufflavum]|uniref:M48 family metalloprotease n=1 Tax=Sphingobium sufflavum TaxID=1129547 RepID=UPI001F2058DA|nr:M48 family metalloprotease [Sphingobium sufflavum]MCE7797278.1 M48 family metalloprotease [Sphingobium sufflavum]